MTTRMETEGAARRIVIKCDGADCLTEKNDEEIAAAGGLYEMGWGTKFDDAARQVRHFCPKHQEGANG